MLELVLGAAFSVVPVMLMIPPMRRLSSFLAKMEDLMQDAVVQTAEIYTLICDGCHVILSVLRRSTTANTRHSRRRR